MPSRNQEPLSPPTCPKCGAGMRLVRKQAHPIHGTKAELHTYQCDECGKSLAQTVKLEGAAH